MLVALGWLLQASFCICWLCSTSILIFTIFTAPATMNGSGIFQSIHISKIKPFQLQIQLAYSASISTHCITSSTILFTVQERRHTWLQRLSIILPLQLQSQKVVTENGKKHLKGTSGEARNIPGSLQDQLNTETRLVSRR